VYARWLAVTETCSVSDRNMIDPDFLREVPARVDDPADARKDIIIERATSAFQPVLKAGSGSVEQFELNWPVRLLLHDRRPCPHPATTDEFANPNFHDVAAAQLAIDGEVEQSTVTQPSFPFKPEPYRPYLLRLQRAFRPHHMAGVPRPTLPRRWVELRMSHCSLHRAGLAGRDVRPKKVAWDTGDVPESDRNGWESTLGGFLPVHFSAGMCRLC
jgi:hypothetical protein